MKRIPILLALILLPAAIHAQSSRDEYEIGETGQSKDYDPSGDTPESYQPKDLDETSFEPAQERDDYDPSTDKPVDYNETVARPHDYDEATDKPRDYDPDYVEGIIYEPGGREAYRKKHRD